MARYKLILAYDGSAFAGSQRQAPAAKSRAGRQHTVQGELEKALKGLGWKGRSVILAGRTDAGANAQGQVAVADLDWAHSPAELMEALNARLPFELVVRDAQVADPAFHPRFDARARSYCYSLFCGRPRDPLRERLAWRVWPELAPRLLDSVAQAFIGQHDFAAFGSAPTRNSGTVRTVSKSEWRQAASDGLLQFDVTADAFLYRMVRRLVFVQVAVAQGRCSKEAVIEALEQGAGSRLPAGLAPAHGLVLMRVDY